MEYIFVDSERLYESAFQELLDRDYRRWIEDRENLEMAHVLACFEDDTLLGLAVADMSSLGGWSKIQNFAVNPNVMGKGIGKGLLGRMEEHLRELGGERIEGEFLICPRMKGLLNHFEWSELKPVFRNFFFTLKDFHPDWHEARVSLPKGFTLIQWNKLESDDHQKLKKWARKGDLLISEEDPHPIEFINSLILKKGDAIAGWMETHRVSEEMIRYTSLYLFPEYRKSGVFIPLLSKSIRLHGESDVPYAVFELKLNETPLSWQHFIEDRLKPSSTRIEEIGYSFKLITML